MAYSHLKSIGEMLSSPRLTKNGKIIPSETYKTKMIIKGKNLITEFVAKNEKAEKGMDRWIAVVEAASWKTPVDLKGTFHAADKVKTGYIFDISGNNFRIHASVLFACPS